MNPRGLQRSGEAGHERKDVDVVGLVMIAALLLLILAVSFLVCWGILHRLNRERDAQERRSPTARAEQVATFPTPRLLVYPGQEKTKVQAAARTQLETYGWIDRSAGLARIPIQRAMGLLVERGLPEVGGGQTRLQLMEARSQTGLQPNEQIPAPISEGTP